MIPLGLRSTFIHAVCACGNKWYWVFCFPLNTLSGGVTVELTQCHVFLSNEWMNTLKATKITWTMDDFMCSLSCGRLNQFNLCPRINSTVRWCSKVTEILSIWVIHFVQQQVHTCMCILWLRVSSICVHYAPSFLLLLYAFDKHWTYNSKTLFKCLLLTYIISPHCHRRGDRDKLGESHSIGEALAVNYRHGIPLLSPPGLSAHQQVQESRCCQ